MCLYIQDTYTVAETQCGVHTICRQDMRYTRGTLEIQHCTREQIINTYTIHSTLYTTYKLYIYVYKYIDYRLDCTTPEVQSDI